VRYIRFKHNNTTHYGSLLEGGVVQQVKRIPNEEVGQIEITESAELLLSEVELLAPCQPEKIIAIAINYPGTSGLTKKTIEPLVFIKPSSSVIGNNQTITSPFNNTLVWGEPELAIVIGKELSKATIEDARKAIFGYTIGNDVSCDNVHGWDHHLARSKGADTFCVLGPWIDTEYNPNGKTIKGYHNNTLIRDGYCQERLWKEPELLVWLSSWITLKPGDVILTGTPKRVQERIYFEDGDRFTCVIEGLGRLSNTFELAK
jgi:2-keto-4-pentenoate hydratase/2-oxohepta-3-ene-1,7-dioic acid hydratase in catechol pathway